MAAKVNKLCLAPREMEKGHLGVAQTLEKRRHANETNIVIPHHSVRSVPSRRAEFISEHYITNIS